MTLSVVFCRTFIFTSFEPKWSFPRICSMVTMCCALPKRLIQTVKKITFYLKLSQVLTFLRYTFTLFSCPRQLNRWHCHSLAHSLDHFWFNGWKICEGPLWETWTFGDLWPQRIVGLPPWISDTHDLNDDLNDFRGISALIHFVDKKISSTIVDEKFHLQLMYEGRYAYC